MRLEKLTRRFAGLLICAGLLSISPTGMPPAQAADAAAKGIAEYNARKYKEAMVSLRQAIVANPRIPTPYYYYAMCQQRTGDNYGARKTYLSIIKSFPNSEEATQAGGIVGMMDRTNAGNQGYSAEPAQTAAPATRVTPTAGTQKTSSSAASKANTSTAESSTRHRGVSGGTGTVSGPDECNIRFERVNNSLILDAMVNYRPTKIIFDTGAEHCVFGKNHLQEMSIKAPTGSPTGKAQGVGAGGTQDTWDMPVTMTVGPITRKDFGVIVQSEMMGQPLLGQTFFQDFTYTIDNGANNIHVRRKNEHTGSIYHQQSDPYALPFTRMGNEIIVMAAINGRPTQVIFDTGASSCAFTKEQVEKLGISIPEDAQKGRSQGIAGETETSIFPISSIKCGPIEKRDFEIHVVHDAKMPAPLLGQSFYGDWQYTIDYESNLIHFVRR
jgi:clan AA aspartic protease (TIGR02281 family)